MCRIRPAPHYRRTAFEEGLKRLGYSIRERAAPTGCEDLLVIWNRQGPDEAEAAAWEARGGTVLVCENGYIGRDAEDRQFYAIAVGGHCGSGWTPNGTEDRFAALGIEVQPWRTDGYYLITGQRGIGSKSMASPPGWHRMTAQKLGRMGINSVRVREHPGRFKPAQSLEQELAGAKACIVWSSASGVKALVMGVPVIYCAPHWVGSAGASNTLNAVHDLKLDDEARRKALHQVAWAQWSVREIEAGEPFARILEEMRRQA